MLIAPPRLPLGQYFLVRLKPAQSLEALREQVDRLGVAFSNLTAYSAGPDREPLRNQYLRWVRDSEEVARRFLTEVPTDQFATNRWRSINDGTVPDNRIWGVIEGDCKAQLDWFKGAIDDLIPPESPNPVPAAEGSVEDQRTSRSAINRIRAEGPGSALRGSWVDR